MLGAYFGLGFLCLGCVGIASWIQRLANGRRSRTGPAQTETLPGSGEWLGTYVPFSTKGGPYGETKSLTTTYKLTFDYDGTVTGTGTDADGTFTVNGVYSARSGRVSWGEMGTDNLRVDVTGRFDASRRSISGRYHANTGVSNAIAIRFMEADASLAPTTKPPAVTVMTPTAPPAPTTVNMVQMEPIPVDSGSDTTAPSS
ncbi:unnamed protein product [Vitrella brassicaformis CCMP3155]|uniref:Uncharacterized protein n=1 Tax=Vitrella brassicaformis (strain CCMP3155) TaxID=1169540 RepID=A0A0G4EYS4_VITBC|nr:unnamed protein product [Vitrella brassicaformis CCMP3155]|eukprot:CEM04091.1 unnamed protein product [Vitrella brassicaformis CCMP3155]